MKPGPCDENSIAIILREVLKGLEYLHDSKKLHRDIKGDSLAPCFHVCSEMMQLRTFCSVKTAM